MSFDDAIDQTKQWFNDRLNSPYFASACAVWVISNISVFFGMFNFEESKTVDQRLEWVCGRINGFNIWIFHGFWGSVVWAGIMGFVVMVGYKFISRVGEWAYHYADKNTQRMVRNLTPGNWISIKEHQKLIEKNLKVKSELIEVKAQLEESESENKRIIEENRTDERVGDLNEEIIRLNNVNENLESRIKELTNTKTSDNDSPKPNVLSTGNNLAAPSDGLKFLYEKFTYAKKKYTYSEFGYGKKNCIIFTYVIGHTAIEIEVVQSNLNWRIRLHTIPKEHIKYLDHIIEDSQKSGSLNDKYTKDNFIWFYDLYGSNSTVQVDFSIEQILDRIERSVPINSSLGFEELPKN